LKEDLVTETPAANKEQRTRAEPTSKAGASPPKRWRQWIPPLAMVLFGGAIWIGLFVYMLSTKISELSDYHRLVVPGEMEIALHDPGTYRLYFESRSRVDGRDYAASSLPRDMLFILIASDGQETTLTPFSGTSTYEFGHYQGEVLGVFHVANPGNYTLRAWSSSGRTSSPAVVALESTPTSVLRIIFLLIGGMCAGGTIGVVGIVWISILVIRNLTGRGPAGHGTLHSPS